MKIIFVCLGNICRSPTAQGVMENLAKKHGISSRVSIDSAGTAAWHSGNPPDPRSVKHAAKRGYDLTSQRSRPVDFSDFYEFDLILAMDKQNYSDLLDLAPSEHKNKVKLFLKEYGKSDIHEVPDPYYKGEEGFEEVLDLLEEACEELLGEIRNNI